VRTSATSVVRSLSNMPGDSRARASAASVGSIS
jgi:hypothetical protein